MDTDFKHATSRPSQRIPGAPRVFEFGGMDQSSVGAFGESLFVRPRSNPPSNFEEYPVPANPAPPTVPTIASAAFNPCGQLTITMSDGSTIQTPLTTPTVTGPSDQSGMPGASLTASATATGTGPLNWNWQDPNGITRSTSSALSTTIGVADYGTWKVTVGNCAGSNSATFQVGVPAGNLVLISGLTPSGGSINHTGYPNAGGYVPLVAQFAFNPSDLANLTLYQYNSSGGYSYPPSGLGVAVFGPAGSANPAPGGATPVWTVSGNIISILGYAANGGTAGAPIITCYPPASSTAAPVSQTVWVAGAFNSFTPAAWTGPTSITCSW